MQTDNVSGGNTLLHMHKQVRTHRLPGALVGVVHIQLQTPQWSFHFLKPQGVQDVFRQPLLAFLCCFSYPSKTCSPEHSKLAAEI